jgi:NAD(P)-dependent dehydrogenase (short-subunit alcohol dehydrogenase family)
MLLKDRAAIVTGSAMGIGKGIALKFAAEGCSLWLADISEVEGEKTADEIRKMGQKAIFTRCDITQNSQVRAMTGQAIEKFGRIDILVNCAGGVPGLGARTIDDVNEDAWDKIVGLNLKSVFLCCKAVIPHMRQNRYGRIINISSMGAIHPPASLVHYHSAKAGVLGLTVNLALELARYNVTVNAVLPGPIRTPFWEPVTRGIADKEAFFSEVAKHEVPMQRIGTPEDVAGTALFLASDLAAYVTGDSIFVGGGLPLPVKS